MEESCDDQAKLKPGDETSFRKQTQNQNENSELKEAAPTKIPPDFLNIVSMPGNWEHIERLKSKRQLLGRNLFQQMRKYDTMNSQNKENAHSDNEYIDVETVSVKNNDEALSERNDLSITFTSVETSSDEDASSDGSILSLKIVEDADSESNIDESDEEGNLVIDVCSSPQEAKSYFEVKAASGSDAAKVENTVLQQEHQPFDDKSDLCQLSAKDINNSLFDTIASLKQQNQPKTNPKKQSSLENIITRIKTEVECNKSTSYRIQKPGPGERLSSPVNSKSDGFLLSSVQTTPDIQTASEKNWHLHQKKQNSETVLKGNESQEQLQNKPMTIVENPACKKQSQVSSTVANQNSKSLETCPVKLKLKRHLKTQQSIQKERKTSEDKGHKINPEHQQKDQSKESCVKQVDDKSGIIEKSGPLSGDEKEKLENPGNSSRIENDNTVHTATSSNSLDDMLKLKSEYYESKLKVLEYESQLLGLKEKLLAKQSMQQYFEALQRRYPYNRGHAINSWVVMSKADAIRRTCQQTSTTGNEKQLTSTIREMHPCSTADPGKVSHQVIPNLVNLSANGKKGSSVAEPCMEISSAVQQQPNAPMLQTESTKSDRTTAEHRSILPAKRPDNLQQMRSPCQGVKEDKNEESLANQFIVKTGTDFQREQLRVTNELSSAQNHIEYMSIGARSVVKKEIPNHGTNHDQELCTKTTKVTTGATIQYQDNSLQSKPSLQSPESTRNTRFLSSQADNPPSCPTIFSSPVMSPRSMQARPELSTTCGRFAVSPGGGETGYQIPRPHGRNGRTNSTVDVASFKPGTKITPTSISKPQPLNAMQLVQLQRVSGDGGRLYALVNNVLEPIVQKVNGQFVPVVGNRPVVQKRPTGVLPVSMAHLGLPLAPPLYSAVASSTSTTALPYAQQRGNNSSVPCTIGQFVIAGTNPADTCQRATGETATIPVTLSNVPNAQKVKSSQVLTVIEGPPNRRTNNSGRNSNMLQISTETPTSESYSNKVTACIVPPKLNEHQTGSENKLLQGQMLMKAKADQTTLSTAVAATGMSRIQNQTVSSSENIVCEKRKENLCDKVEKDCKDEKWTESVEQSSEGNADRTPKEKNQYPNPGNNPPSKVIDWESIIMNQGEVLQRNDKAGRTKAEMVGKVSHDKKQKSGDVQKETILTFSQGKVETTCNFKDANNNKIVTPDKKRQENNATNTPDNEGVNTSHVISDTLDSDDSFDSVEWEMFQNSHRANQDKNEFPKSTRNNLASVCKEKQTVPVSSTAISKKRKSMSPILKENTTKTTSTGHEKQPRSDKEGHKKIVKTKLIILKGEVCERWQEIKRKTFLCEGLSDASFVHYLLNLEETRQAKVAHMHKQYKREQAEKTTRPAVGCNGDAGRTSSLVFAAELRTAKKFAEAKPASAEKTTTPLSALKRRKSETPRGKKKADRETISRSQNPKLTRSGRNVEKPERYRLQHQETATTNGPVLPAAKKNLKRKLESATSETSETSYPSKRGKFEFLSETIKKQMSWALSVFVDWLEQRGEDFHTIYDQDASWLDEKLQQFYVHARTLDGFPYPSRVLQTFRRALSMCLTMFSDTATIKIGISLDTAFSLSNLLLAKIMRSEEENGDMSVKLTEPIIEADMDKLYSTRTLSDKQPTCLLWKVFFDIVHHLCRSKMPLNFLENLEKRNLTLESDANGVYYSFSYVGYVPACETPGRMYATPSHPERCPVRSASLYLSKLHPDCPALFQQPCDDWLPQEYTGTQWYLPVAMKKADLNSTMENISRHAKLSRVYTLADLMATPTGKQEASSD